MPRYVRMWSGDPRATVAHLVTPHTSTALCGQVMHVRLNGDAFEGKRVELPTCKRCTKRQAAQNA